ncbi:MAG: HIT domain-containing protein [Nanoarchaeota archaeon]
MVSEEDLKNMSPEEIQELQRQNCVFCRIGKKEIPSKVVYEDDIVIAFLDIQPVSFGHVLLTTKNHYVFFSQVPDDETGHLFRVAKQISQSMLKALQVKGTNMLISNGEAAGQQAPHCIMHIVPRKEGVPIHELQPPKEGYSLADLTKIQHALIARIDETMETDMKTKLLASTQEEKQAETKAEEAPAAKKQQHEETKPEQKAEEEKKERKHDQEDIDLDKISDLFK